MLSKILDGFKFGMMLQLAVGPVCLYVFSSACTDGFGSAEAAVAAVTIIDALFILFAILGITAFLSNDTVKKNMKIIGAAIVFIFGVNSILDSLNFGFLNLNISISSYDLNNPFIKGALLTASNPLTILFWAGVFSAKLADSGTGRADSYRFGLGAVLSTFIFLSFIAYTGSVITVFLNPEIIRLLNIAVGIVLVVFAILMIRRK